MSLVTQTLPNRVVLLGTKGGPALRKGGAMPTSSLLDLDGQRVVIDCGLGVTKALVEAGVDLKSLSLIFVTHLHSDHLLELGPLVHTAWTSGLKAPLTIYGPPGIEVYWAGFMQSVAYESAIRVYDEGRVPLADLVNVRIYGEGEVMDGPLRVTALQVPHPPLEHCFALRFDGSRGVTFSGDTACFPPLAAFARRSDLLIHEAMLPAGVDLIVAKTGLGEKLRAHLFAAHSTVQEAALIARDAGVARLALHHLIPVDDDRFGEADWLALAATVWDGPVILGRDGLEILL